MVHHIVHLDIPDFYTTLEGLRRPELQKRPLALAEPGPRAVIQDINARARSEGICEGMPATRARRLCRQLVVFPPDLHFYKKQHQSILQEFDHFSPLVEGTYLGHYFIDLTGTQRLWGASPDLACRMEQRLEEHQGLRARVGLAVNKLISQVAAHCSHPGDLSYIFPGGETAFFAPLPVTALPGVGSKTASRLSDFNIQQIGQLANLPESSLISVFGNMGSRLSRLAHGIDPTPVVPFQRTPRLSLVHDLAQDEIDRLRLEAILFQQTEEAGWNLRRHNRYPKRLGLEIRYADGVTVRGQQQLEPRTTHLDRRLFRAIRSAFKRLVQRRIAIRRIVLEFSEFTMPFRQMSLFPWEESSLQKDQKLQQALDGIRQRFGRQVINWGQIRLHDQDPDLTI